MTMRFVKRGARAAVARVAVAGLAAAAASGVLWSAARSADQPPLSSYAPVVIKETFEQTEQRMKAEKPAVMQRQKELLEARYDLSSRPSADTKMDRQKPVQEGVRAKLPSGVSWDDLAAMTPEQIQDKDQFPAGFMPLPHPHHAEGGMVFPDFHIKEIQKQEARDLNRFDLEFDLPDHFLPEFPPAIYLTTRPDLGDVSQGKLVTIDNYYELFNGILNPKQLEGLRMLLTPFAQQQFNLTEDRRSEKPSRGVTCFDCHDAHGTPYPSNLRKPAQELCLDCHGPSSPNGPRASTLEEHTHHKADGAGSQCVACHMPTIAQTIGDVNVRSHTFRFVTPATTDSLKIPNACTLCHADRSTAWATEALKSWPDRSPWRMAQ